MGETRDSVEVAIIGGGAAGLATAIFTARRARGMRIAILDGAKKLGAKILVSGGGRCNVTNAVVKPTDFFGGSVHIIKRVLVALSVEQTIAFFRELGVSLHEEAFGKLFPDSNTARTVLDALVCEAQRLGVDIRCDHRVIGLTRTDGGFLISTIVGEIAADRVVLATGGLSLPKTGSDGFGYELARSLGHGIVPTTPGLAPLVLSGEFHKTLSGISLDAELTLRATGEKPRRIAGPMLWTHFGISGPAALDASRHWHRARLDGREVTITACFLPGRTFEEIEGGLLAQASSQPRSTIHHVLARELPTRMAEAVLRHLRIEPRVQMSHLSREDRRRLSRGLVEWPLPVINSRGYAYAEVTAGGVPLGEIDAATMESRICPGLYFAGEILDCEGRLGGFNFQWAWASGFVAAGGLTRA